MSPLIRSERRDRPLEAEGQRALAASDRVDLAGACADPERARRVDEERGRGPTARERDLVHLRVPRVERADGAARVVRVIDAALTVDRQCADPLPFALER